MCLAYLPFDFWDPVDHKRICSILKGDGPEFQRYRDLKEADKDTYIEDFNSLLSVMPGRIKSIDQLKFAVDVL